MFDMDVATESGHMPVQFFSAADDAPLIIILMDAIGIREELRDVARHLQREGYNVALPNLYYREGDIRDLDMNRDRDVIMRLYAGYSHAMATEDMGALLEHVSQRPVGLLGYCMGGAKALVLAGIFPDTIAASAAIHPGGIATEAEDSPHRIAPHARGELYIAIADQDPYATESQIAQLREHLDNADSHYTLEVYQGAQHGFAFESLPTFNGDARTRYLRSALALFQRALH